MQTAVCSHMHVYNKSEINRLSFTYFTFPPPLYTIRTRKTQMVQTERSGRMKQYHHIGYM
ncbi:hypothetical protein CLOM621_07142 [Clostridium sp. M62/1]|nr:hypothetical protein CLOM621_07142 [Clostridium sp. M62/1]